MKIKALVAVGLAAVVLAGTAAVGLASNGFTEKDITEWTLSVRNEENLFKVEDYILKTEKADEAAVTALNDGRITINGENTRKTELPVEIGTLSLDAGTYTFSSGWKDASYKTAYLKFVTADSTYEFDLGDNDGTHEFSAPVEGTVILVLTEGAEFKRVELQPTVVEGKKPGDFYK